VEGIQVCSNKGPGPLQRGDNHINVKMGWGIGEIITKMLEWGGVIFLLKNYVARKYEFYAKDLDGRQVGLNIGPRGSDGANGNEMHI
jgi:hypothetical protein